MYVHAGGYWYYDEHRLQELPLVDHIVVTRNGYRVSTMLSEH